MKRCPQCDLVYENDNDFCASDGTRLVEEKFTLPSSESDFEAETIIRREPIVVDLSTPAVKDTNYQAAPPVVESVIVREVPSKSNSRSAAVYLALGLVLGGILVLTTLLLARNFYADNPANDNSREIAVNVSEAKPKNSLTATENRNENKGNLTETASLKHDQPTSASGIEFNGRVIAINARVRSAASKSAAQIDVLPLNDRINIERRENENSPWFYVTCEHGTDGWMHGDTIEFTQ